MTGDWLEGWAEDIEPPAAIDTTVAHQARIYDHWLGGKDNFAVDREAAQQAIAAYPPILRGGPGPPRLRIVTGCCPGLAASIEAMAGSMITTILAGLWPEVPIADDGAEHQRGRSLGVD